MVVGEDDFNARRRCREVFDRWATELGGAEQEIIDGAAGNSSEALKALGRLNEALQTLPFFGSGKVVWLQRCTFLAEDRTSESQAVSEAVAGLAQSLKTFQWDKIRLIVEAPKIDKRKAFFKTLDKIGSVETFAGLSLDDKDWAGQAELMASRHLKSLGLTIRDDALAELIARVGPDTRALSSEIEKLSLYVTGRTTVTVEDIETIITLNKQARAFALGDAVGDRDLPRLLSCLEDEMWSMKTDPQKSTIGLLYGIISKIRVLILLKELLRLGHLKQGSDYSRLKTQIERIPDDLLPADKKFNPKSINPYVLFRALPQAERYTIQELTTAMESLLECNFKLVSSGLDSTLVLQQTLIRIVGQPQQSRNQRFSR